MSKEEKAKEDFLDKYRFTSCEDCIHKVNKTYQEECLSCRNYYGCLFEMKKNHIKKLMNNKRKALKFIGEPR